MTQADDTTSVIDHRDHLQDHLRQVQATGRPLFVTTDGQTVAVVLSSSAFDRLTEQAETATSLAMLHRSIDDLKAGRTLPAKHAIDAIASELGLTLERHPARG